MTDPLTEAVARAMRDAYIKANDTPPYNTEAHYPLYMFTDEAEAALAIARPAIRREALEEAARVAQGMWWQGHGNLATEPYAAAKQAGDEIAAAIRAMISKE